jgi:hypothetical protein
MSDKLVDFTWRHDEHQAYGVMNIKAGDTIKIPEREALRMQLNGNGTIGKVLKPHVHDQAAFDKFMKEEAAKHHNPEFDQKPGCEPIGARYPHSFARQGWS